MTTVPPSDPARLADVYPLRIAMPIGTTLTAANPTSVDLAIQERCAAITAAAEWVLDRIADHTGPGPHSVALVAPMRCRTWPGYWVEGAGGLVTCAARRGWTAKSERSLNRVTITGPRGIVGVCTIYSADEPDQLRGLQHHSAWWDEAGPSTGVGNKAWTNLQFSLRLGDDPLVIVTNAPDPHASQRGTPLAKAPTQPNPTAAAKVVTASPQVLHDKLAVLTKSLAGVTAVLTAVNAERDELRRQIGDYDTTSVLTIAEELQATTNEEARYRRQRDEARALAGREAGRRAELEEDAWRHRRVGPVVPLAEVKVTIAHLEDARSESDRLGDRCAELEGQVAELLPWAAASTHHTVLNDELPAATHPAILSRDDQGECAYWGAVVRVHEAGERLRRRIDAGEFGEVS